MKKLMFTIFFICFCTIAISAQAKHTDSPNSEYLSFNNPIFSENDVVDIGRNYITIKTKNDYKYSINGEGTIYNGTGDDLKIIDLKSHTKYELWIEIDQASSNVKIYSFKTIGGFDAIWVFLDLLLGIIIIIILSLIIKKKKEEKLMAFNPVILSFFTLLVKYYPQILFVIELIVIIILVGKFFIKDYTMKNTAKKIKKRFYN